MNEDRTCEDGGTNLTQLGSPDVHGARRRFDAKAVRASLDAIRARHGADTPIGHRCSNLIEMMKNRETATPDLRRDLDKYIAATVEELARLSAQNAEER